MTEIVKDLKGIPKEIMDMGVARVKEYWHILSSGSVPSNHIRCMIVGHFGVGKTTLVHSLLERNIKHFTSTEGIEVHKSMCFVYPKAADKTKLKPEYTWEIKEKPTDEILGIQMIQVDFWDFAGQAIYYNTHPTYFSYRCLYLLTIDVSKDLQDKVNDETIDFKKKRRSVLEFLHFWISTILQQCRQFPDGNSGECNCPKIVIVGTHKDEMQDLNKLKKLVTSINRTFPKLIKRRQLICKVELFINAKMMNQDELRSIRDTILEEGMSYPTFGEKIPSKWVRFHKQLQELKHGHSYLEKEEETNTTRQRNSSVEEDEKEPLLPQMQETIETKNRREQNDSFIDSKNEKREVMVTFEEMDTLLQGTLPEEYIGFNLELFLEFFTSTGQILYLAETALKNCIIIDPQWIINSLRCLITHNIERRQRVSRSGTIDLNRIFELWKEDGLDYSAEHCKHLLSVMTKLDFICQQRRFEEDGRIVETDAYYVPSMMTDYVPNESIPPQLKMSNKFNFIFKENLLPPSIFNKLVCYYLGIWQLDGPLYSDLVLLKIDHHHRLDIRRLENRIEVSLLSRENVQHSDIAELLIGSMSETLDRITGFAGLIGEKKLYRKPKVKHSKVQFPWQSQRCSGNCKGLDSRKEEELREDHLMKIALSLDEKSRGKIAEDLGILKRENKINQSDNNQKATFLMALLKPRGESDREHAIKIFRTHLPSHTFCKVLKHQPAYCRDFKEKVTEEFLNSAAIYVGFNPLPLGVELGLSVDEIQKLANKYPRETLKLTQHMLREWHIKNEYHGNNVDEMKVLALAFQEANCNMRPFKRLQ